MSEVRVSLCHFNVCESFFSIPNPDPTSARGDVDLAKLYLRPTMFFVIVSVEGKQAQLLLPFNHHRLLHSLPMVSSDPLCATNLIDEFFR